jgi:dipeptidyl-peptidase-4
MNRPRFSVAITLLIVLQSVGCAATQTAAPMPDYAEYRTAAAEIMRFDTGGRIRNVAWREDGTTLTFVRLGERYAFDLNGREFIEIAGVDSPPNRNGEERRGRRRDRRRGPGRGRQFTRESAPDGSWTAICRDCNVVLESEESDETVTVTTDGTRKFRYGMANWVYGEELDERHAMWWSPDSKRLVFYEFDEREVPDFYLLGGWTKLRTEPLREGYSKPGEANPIVGLLLYDLETKQTTRLETNSDESDEWYIYNVRFTPDGSEVLFNRTNRHQNLLHVVAADPETGEARIVVKERQATWQRNNPTMRFLDDGRRFIWETERDGVRQYELRHLDGRRLATLTGGATDVISIVRLDEPDNVLYYTAYSDLHPLNVHLYRVNLDGTDRRRLTREPARHSIRISPDGRWFITQYETITQPPVTALYDTEGARIATLAESETELIAEQGWPDPELFTFTAADGETDLYGWLYKPKGFDPRRSYPLVIDVYGGPDSKGVRNSYRLAHPGCLYGFLVAKIDNRGTGGRGKAFLGAAYQRLGDVDLRDQADGARFLAQRPYVDAERIGIYGHSYGGYMAALALLRYPDVFSAAVAGAPVTDWRNYDTIYTERYMRTPQENPDGYEEGSCLTFADQLEGDLLLLQGMVDDNVHPTNAWQLIGKLQEEGARFEMHFFPESGHSLGRGATRLQWEFLYDSLTADHER